MKRVLCGAGVALICACVLTAHGQSAIPFVDRSIIVNVQARLLDDQDLPFDGTVDVRVQLYTSPGSDPADLFYSESFSGVLVDRGLLRLPVFGGTPDPATPFSKSALASVVELYADIEVNGLNMVSGKPLGVAFAAFRSEYARYAEGVRSEFVVDLSKVPDLSATLISTGVLNAARVPQFSPSKITSGTFGIGQIPLIPADKINGGVFSHDVLPSTLTVAQFDTTKKMLDTVVDESILRKDDVAFDMGIVGNNGFIDVPEGFDRSECKVLLSLREIDGWGGVDQYHIAYRPTGEVECWWSSNEMGTERTGCLANYLTICKKY